MVAIAKSTWQLWWPVLHLLCCCWGRQYWELGFACGASSLVSRLGARREALGGWGKVYTFFWEKYGMGSWPGGAMFSSSHAWRGSSRLGKTRSQTSHLMCRRACKGNVLPPHMPSQAQGFCGGWIDSRARCNSHRDTQATQRERRLTRSQCGTPSWARSLLIVTDNCLLPRFIQRWVGQAGPGPRSYKGLTPLASLGFWRLNKVSRGQHWWICDLYVSHSRVNACTCMQNRWFRVAHGSI